MERLPYILVLMAYSVGAVGHLLPRVADGRLARAARPCVGVGGGIHALTLVGAVLWEGAAPGFPHALSATSLGVMLAYLWVGTGRLRSLGMLLVPLGLVLLGMAQVVPHHQVNALEHTGMSPWLVLHIFLVFVGIAGFTLSCAVGGTYLWAWRRLKEKQFDGLGRIPSLEVLDRIQFRAMLFGFVFLTLGIGVGGAWAAGTLQEAWTFDPKVWFTVSIWFWYGIALQVRLVAGRRGRWTALFSIVGFAGVVFSLLGVNFLISGWHGYG